MRNKVKEKNVKVSEDKTSEGQKRWNLAGWKNRKLEVGGERWSHTSPLDLALRLFSLPLAGRSESTCGNDHGADSIIRSRFLQTVGAELRGSVSSLEEGKKRKKLQLQ